MPVITKNFRVYSGLLQNAGAVSYAETQVIERRGCGMPMAPLAFLEYAVGAIGRLNVCTDRADPGGAEARRSLAAKAEGRGRAPWRSRRPGVTARERRPRWRRALRDIDVRPIYEADGRKAGELLAAAGLTDAVDATAALLAEPGDRLYTSDPEDLRTLCGAAGNKAAVLGC
jgi:hypothetical protein